MKQIVLFFSLLLSFSGFTQDKITWSVPVKGNAKGIFFHQFTQTPLVETSDAFYGMDPGQKKIVWTLDRSSLYKTLKTLQTISAVTGSSTNMDISEYEEIPYTPFAVICNNLINVANGQIILGDEKTAFRQWLGHDLIPQLNLLLAKVTDAEGNVKLYAINLLSDKIEWETLLIDKANTKGLSNLINTFSDALTINVFIPNTNADKNIIYNNDKKLTLLDGKNGKILWENECNPNAYFMSKDSETIFAIEKRSGWGNAISLSGPQVFGKKVYCIDAQTGNNIWSAPIKLDATYVAADFISTDRILLAHKDGFNLYDIKDGKKIWKKDYSAKNTKEITLTPQGIEVQYGNKLMLVNAENGKKVWKKPIE
ncbi:MAG: PQQ-like beta-propeller repeat protein, partial [Odoribacter sp.]|nr:PQQ-like beta-propeller repeat protein [Odoribacter sp.]